MRLYCFVGFVFFLLLFLVACDGVNIRSPKFLGTGREVNAPVTGSAREELELPHPLGTTRIDTPLNNILVEHLRPSSNNDYVIHAQLSKYHQAQLYTFQGVLGQQLNITMRSEDFDAFLIVLDSQGNVVAVNDDHNNPEMLYSLDAALTVTLPQTGLYFLLASSFHYIDTILSDGSIDNLNYHILMTTLQDGEATSTILPQNSLARALQSGDFLRKEHHTGKSVSYFSFDAAVGDTVKLRLHSEDFDTLLQLYAPSGQRVAVSDDAVGQGTNSSIRYMIPVAGRYLVLASDVFFYNQGRKNALLKQQGGEFFLDFSHDSADRPENPDSVEDLDEDPDEDPDKDLDEDPDSVEDPESVESTEAVNDDAEL